MCFVQAWYWLLWASAMAGWLLQSIVVGFLKGPKMSMMRLHSNSASFTPCVAAMYSLLMVDNETISCCFEDHKMVPPSMKNV